MYPGHCLQVLSVLCRKTCWAARAVTSALTSSFLKLCSPSRMGFSQCRATCSLLLWILSVPTSLWVLSTGMCCGNDTGGRAKATCGAGGIKKPCTQVCTQNTSLAGEEGFSATALLCQGKGWDFSRAERTNPMQSRWTLIPLQSEQPPLNTAQL